MTIYVPAMLSCVVPIARGIMGTVFLRLICAPVKKKNKKKHSCDKRNSIHFELRVISAKPYNLQQPQQLTAEHMYS